MEDYVKWAFFIAWSGVGFMAMFVGIAMAIDILRNKK